MPKYMKAIKPKPLNVDAMRTALVEFMAKQGVAIRKSFDTTTSTWRHNVEFTPEIEMPGTGLGGMFGVEVVTEDDLYRLVNQGSPEHWIAPVKGKALRFPQVFLPKSIPGLIRANPGYISNRNSFSKGMLHPGFPARKFDVAVKEDFEPKFTKAVKNELMQTLRQVSGHKAT